VEADATRGRGHDLRVTHDATLAQGPDLFLLGVVVVPADMGIRGCWPLQEKEQERLKIANVKPATTYRIKGRTRSIHLSWSVRSEPLHH